MSIENRFASESKAPSKETEKAKIKIESLFESLIAQREAIHPFVAEYFQESDFLSSLPEAIQRDEQELAGFIINTSKFFDIVSECQKCLQDGESLFGEDVHLAESVHADGRTRRAESGRKINVDFLRNKGIDPLKVLFFRITQEAKVHKPEYYWTTDYFETQKGLLREMPVEQRTTAITLVASLEAINNNDGLIQDINDDNGLAVRQIGTESFDQDLAIARIRAR